MPKLEVKENKKLILRNVLQKHVEKIELSEIDSEISKFINFIEIAKIETVGPLVTFTKGIQISDEGLITMDYVIMVQTQRKNGEHGSYKFVNEFILDNCIYVRYEGRPEEMQFAQNKLELYEWEHELTATGEQATVFVNETELSSTVDIFRKIV
jgi:hypothetical protein